MTAPSWDHAHVERVRAVAERIREESADGRLVPAGELDVGRGAGEVLATMFAALGGEADDIESVTSDGATLFYSTRVMTRRYAELTARADRPDLNLVIAETVRDESATYPRPTPVDVFLEPPFAMGSGALEEAIAAVLASPGDDDIRLFEASDGSRFLFSTRHLDERHAAALAEWAAVGRANNP